MVSTHNWHRLSTQQTCIKRRENQKVVDRGSFPYIRDINPHFFWFQWCARSVGLEYQLISGLIIPALLILSYPWFINWLRKSAYLTSGIQKLPVLGWTAAVLLRVLELLACQCDHKGREAGKEGKRTFLSLENCLICPRPPPQSFVIHLQIEIHLNDMAPRRGRELPTKQLSWKSHWVSER